MAIYTQEEILLAWKTFVAQGVILEDKVRPIVGRSWERCLNQGLDPWSADFPKFSEDIFKAKRLKSAELLGLAGPIMRYIYLILNCNVAISDADGFVYELITPLKNYPRTLGTFISEATNGNGAITITLNEKVPARTDGYEHYRVISHSYSNVSAPLMPDHRTMTGVITAVSPFGPLPDKTLSLVISAAKTIEQLMLGRGSSYQNLSSINSFQEMLDYCVKPIVIADEEGTILALNESGLNLIGMGEKKTVPRENLKDYLENENEFLALMSNDIEWREKRRMALKLPVSDRKERVFKFFGVRKGNVRLASGVNHVVFVLDPVEEKENQSNKQWTKSYSHFHFNRDEVVDYIGESLAWRKVDEIIHKAAPFPSNVLLEGESGTGKEVAARAIHRLSKRKGSFVAINCGAIPRELLYSELFGYEGGAFTGARAGGAMGKFEHAHEGTLFLDEIGEMPLDMQVSLLRFLQERTVSRINSNKSREVDVRIIAATNKEMAQLVRIGQFRQDLYYRLNVIEIKLPPLRERKSDIHLLANYFVTQLSKQFKVEPRPVSEDVIHILCQYDWPGNVRELKNVMEKALVLSEGMIIFPEDLPEEILKFSAKPIREFERGNQEELSERQQIIRCLEEYNGNIVKTAKALNMARNTLYRKIEKMDIKFKVAVLNDKKG